MRKKNAEREESRETRKASLSSSEKKGSEILLRQILGEDMICRHAKI